MNIIHKQIIISVIISLIIVSGYHIIFWDVRENNTENSNINVNSDRIGTSDSTTNIPSGWENSDISIIPTTENQGYQEETNTSILPATEYQEYPEGYNDDLIRIEDRTEDLE